MLKDEHKEYEMQTSGSLRRGVDDGVCVGCMEALHMLTVGCCNVLQCVVVCCSVSQRRWGMELMAVYFRCMEAG